MTRAATGEAELPGPRADVLERRLAAHQEIAGILAGGAAAADVPRRVLRVVAERLAWPEVLAWEAGEGARDLELIEAWPAPDPAAAPDPRGRAGQHATAAWRKRSGIWSAADAGTTVAIPLTGPDGVLGVLELRTANHRPQDAGALAALEAIGHLLGAFLGHRRAIARHATLRARETVAQTRAERAERRARFLAEAGPVLSASLDLGSTASTATHLAVPELADFCAVDALEDDGSVRRVGVSHRVRARERAAWDSARRHPAGEAAVRRALETGNPVLVPSTDQVLVAAGIIDAHQVRAMRSLDVATALVVPLRAPTGVLGAITLGVGGPERAIGVDDLAFAEGLADRLSQAILNARLYEAERRARTEAQRSAAALGEAQERLRLAFDHAPIGMALVSLASGDLGRWLEVNPALCDIVGRPAEELLRAGVLELTHPDDRDADRDAMEALISGTLTELRREKRFIHAAGHPVWVQIRATAVRGKDGRALHSVAQVQDITDRKRYEQQLHYLADHDALTGIYNRRRFEEELDRAVAHAQRFGETAAVLVVDLDNFKYVNDTYGHAVGDELLGRVAGALKDRLRTTDVLARLGGDEFAAILPRVCADAARAAAEHLLSAVRAEGHVLIGERKVRATCSIGINAIDPTTRLTAEELLVEADLAMFEAKEAGRDRIASVAPGEASRAKMKARMTWSERVRDALEHDHFELWEQPILTLATGSVDRAEVLVRMLDASGEAIAPGVFLYIAERFGQIQAVDRWVISRAIRLLAERGRILEVNLSGASITDEATIDFIAAEIRNAPIDPTQLVFEVTETTAIVNVERARRFARRLADLGCQFALDDFGSGFGSFYYLKHLPFDCVKIDGDFVKELPASPADQLTVKAIVQIARGLGKETVAEFVQDDRSMQLLREYGVDYAQGYHVGRPRRATAGRRPAPLTSHV